MWRDIQQDEVSAEQSTSNLLRYVACLFEVEQLCSRLPTFLVFLTQEPIFHGTVHNSYQSTLSHYSLRLSRHIHDMGVDWNDPATERRLLIATMHRDNKFDWVEIARILGPEFTSHAVR